LQSISMHVESPVVGAIVDDPAPVLLMIVADRPVANIVATIGGKSAPVTYDPTISRYTGSISLASLPSPAPYQLTVRVTDTQNDVAQSTATLRLDRKPILQVSAPADSTVLTASTRVTATCTDDAETGCSLLRAYIEGFAGTPIVSGTGSIDRTLIESLALFTSGPVRIVFDARDSAGQSRQIVRTVIVP
jgi:hypothetical protein